MNTGDRRTPTTHRAAAGRQRAATARCTGTLAREGRPTLAREGRPTLAREDRAEFDTRSFVGNVAPPIDSIAGHATDTDAADDLRGTVGQLTALVDQLHRILDEPNPPSGRTAALTEVLGVVDRAQAAATRLAGSLDTGRTSMAHNGVPLKDVLAMSTTLTGYQQRTLLRSARALDQLPTLATAFNAGLVGEATVRATVAEARTLDDDARAQVDRCFTGDQLHGATADETIDRVREVVSAHLADDRAEEQETRKIERRFLSVRPEDDGSLTLYGEFDAETGTTVLEALHAAAGPPNSSRHDHSRHADTGPESPGALSKTRTRGRQYADALLRLAEGYLGGDQRTRPRPRVQVIADIATLTGHDDAARAARLLWASHGLAPALTPRAARRLASDADLQFVLTDGHHVLGVTRPTPAIPARVRSAVRARDRHCRFPGCSAPIHWCDLHHVLARENGGPTTVDNLVALCRRHHTAVTQGRWRLAMDDDAMVTVKRGRRTAVSRPPPTAPP